MSWLLIALLTVHGLVHLLGFGKAFGLAEIPELGPVSRPAGVAWLVAGTGFLGTAVLILASARAWWVPGLAAVVLSQALVFASWSDARYGTVANVVILAAVVHGFAAQGPTSLRARYGGDVAARMAAGGGHGAAGRGGAAERGVLPAAGAGHGEETAAWPGPGDRESGLVTEADLAHLPEPVRRYLRVTGAVGRPRVRSFRASWRGRIRSGPGEPWIPFVAEQYDFVDGPARFFLMDARKGGLPVDVYHVFRDGAATMEVRLLSLLPLVNASGPELTRSESVTILNDLALLAPETLLDAGIRWEPVDDRSARAHYDAGAGPVGALLEFDETGELVDFVSDDRSAASPDGSTFVRHRWSTPVGGYRDFGGRRLMSRGEGRWHAPEGTWTYIELELLEVEANPAGEGRPLAATFGTHP